MDLITGTVYDTSVQPPHSYSAVARGNRSLRSGRWYDLDVFLVDPKIPPGTIPATLNHRPVRMGAFFQISHSSTELPVEDPDEIPQRQTQYYDQLFSANLEETPYEDIITSAQHGNLTVTISSGHGIEGTHISAWTFSSPNLNFSSPPMAITNSKRYRAELFAIMKSLYIICKTESIVTPDSSTTINIQCSHKTALVEAFRDSPLGIKTATQLNYDLLMDIRSLRNMI